MGTRLTEKRIPLGYNVEDLGQVGTTTNDDFSLISTFDTPIPEGAEIHYFVFTNIEPEPSTYRWIVVSDGHNQAPLNQETEFGKFSLLAERGRTYEIIVEAYGDLSRDQPIAVMQMIQEVKLPDYGLDQLIENEDRLLEHLEVQGNIGTLGGHPTTSRELINYYRRDILAATQLDTCVIPTRFLAALLYMQILSSNRFLIEHADGEELDTSLIRMMDLETTAEELNSQSGVIPSALGIGQIALEYLAMGINRPTSSDSYTPLREVSLEDPYPNSVLNRLGFQRFLDDIRQDYGNLSIQVKVDLFNLLRFPKSCIRVLVEYLTFLLTRPTRSPGINKNEVLRDDQIMEILATEYRLGSLDESNTNAVIPEALLVPIEYAKRVVELMEHPLIALYFTDAEMPGAEAYGGHSLRRGDSDNRQIFGGVSYPEPGNHVLNLQQDLQELGFLIIGNPDGGFGRRSEWAVREFQIYAKMKFLARHRGTNEPNYVDNLEQTPNLIWYTGPISGVANTQTRILIQYWKAQELRCPVVIKAIFTNGNELDGAGNIWIYNEMQNPQTDVYVVDFTEYYQSADQDDNLVGMYTPYLNGGPVSLKLNNYHGHNRTHPRHLVTPESLIGIPTADLLQSHADPITNQRFEKIKSTYKVVRSIAEVESTGYFDSINAYDNAIISIGMYHWTLGRPDQPNDLLERDGEMCAFLGYLKRLDPKEFDRYFRQFGVQIDREWGDDGQSFFKIGHSKFSGWLERQIDNGDFEFFPRSTPEANYFRSWHWFYRITMATRDSPIVKQINWHFTRIRIRALLALTWNVVPNPVPAIPRLTLFDVYSSEKAVALILRGHVNFPARICDNGVITNQVLGISLSQAILNNPNLNWNQNPSAWDDAHEEALVTELLTRLNIVWNNEGNFDTIANTFTWENEALSQERDSFRFFEA